MVKTKYTMDLTGKNIARGMLKNERVSWKTSVEMARFIKGMPLVKAEQYINDVMVKKRYLPLRRFNQEVPHRPGIERGIKTGKYPVNVSKAFLKLIDNVKNNADYKGLDVNKLRIIHASATKGLKLPKLLKTPNGLRLIHRKSANIELIAREE